MTIRTAIIGLGNVAERIHLPACREAGELQVVAASETRPGRAEEMRVRFAIPAVFTDYTELLAREHPDLVIIGTPPQSHREIAIAALRAGADVICEKPFMLDVAEADEVIAEARKAGRVLRVNTQYRYMPIYRRSRERLQAGEFGRLLFLQCWQQMFHPPHFEKLEWRSALKKSTLYEFGAHPLDLICTFMDALPISVVAHIPRPVAGLDSDVLVQMTLRFPGERLATLALNRISNAPERYLEMRLDCERASLRISLGGVARGSVEMLRHRGHSRPAVRLSFAKGGEARVESNARSRTLVREPGMAFASATASHLRDYLAGRNSGEPPGYAEAGHAREIMRVVEAGYESAETGRVIVLRAE